MLYLTVEGHALANSIEKPFSNIRGFTLGAPTSPMRCDDPRDQDYLYHHPRTEAVIAFVKEALAGSTHKINDQSFGVWLGDVRDASCRFYSWAAAKSTDYLIPDPHYLLAKGYQEIASKSCPWHLRENLVFWRGGLTRPIDYWEADAWDYPRYRLVEELLDHPRCDVKLCFSDYGLVGGPCFASTASRKYHENGHKPLHSLIRRAKKSMLYRLDLRELADAFIDRRIRIYREKMLGQFEKSIYKRGLVSIPLSMAEWGRYRYTIDIDGFGPSWKLFPCLAQGMVVFKVASSLNLFFGSSLRAWEHYVPICSDLSDLQQRIDWAFDHQKECSLISENAIRLCMNEAGYSSALATFASSLRDCC